jgi:hypothetical protein
VTIFRRPGSEFNETTLGANNNYTTPLLPGLEIPLEGVS